MFPSRLQPLSPNFFSWCWPSGVVSQLWSSSLSSFCPAGGAERGDRDSMKGTRRLPARREKTPLRGKTKRKTVGEGDRERNRRITHFLSRSLSKSGDWACGAPSWGLGLFSYWTLHFLLPLQPQSLDSIPGPVDGQLSLTSDQLRMCLCVESCRYRTLARLLCIFYITMCLSFLERNNCFICSSFPGQPNGLPNTFPV